MRMRWGPDEDENEIDGLVQEKCNSSALAMELHFFSLTHRYEDWDYDEDRRWWGWKRDEDEMTMRRGCDEDEMNCKGSGVHTILIWEKSDCYNMTAECFVMILPQVVSATLCTTPPCRGVSQGHCQGSSTHGSPARQTGCHLELCCRTETEKKQDENYGTSTHLGFIIYWWSINIGSGKGLVLLPEPMLITFYDVKYPHHGLGVLTLRPTQHGGYFATICKHFQMHLIERICLDLDFTELYP